MSAINIKKENLIKDLKEKTGFSSNYSKKLINDLINILIIEIKNRSLILKNIGTFKTISKKERLGRNPKTKKEFIITARKSISFTASLNISKYLDFH